MTLSREWLDHLRLVVSAHLAPSKLAHAGGATSNVTITKASSGQARRLHLPEKQQLVAADSG